jgi:hypothetical protein
MKKNVLIQILLQLMFLLTLISCSENTTNEPKQVKNLEENIKNFTKKHVSICKEIFNLLDKENDLNFDNFPYSKLDAYYNEKEFKIALAKTGMVKYEDMYNLLIRLNQNSNEFFVNNKQFTLLKPEKRNTIISDAIKLALIDNPLKFTSLNINSEALTAKMSCRETYLQDREDCAEDALINWGILASSCWFGTPAACAVGGVGVLAIAAVCSNRAKRDYAECLN